MPIRFILFDAVGTLFYPQPSVATAYHQVGQRFGSLLTEAEIRPRFVLAYQRVFRDTSDLATDAIRERSRWRTVVGDVFRERPADCDGIFKALWEHFADPQHWPLFDDVAPAWSELTARGFSLGIASNFDARLRQIIAGQACLANCEHVFVSTEIGHAKPALSFYRAIEQRLDAQPSEILIIGDDLENDVAAPRRAGWYSCAIVRELSAPTSPSLLEVVLAAIHTATERDSRVMSLGR